MQVFRVDPAIGKGQRQLVIGGPGEGANALLGRLAELGPTKQVVFDLDKQHVVAVVGKRGSGKTHTLGVFVEGLAAAGCRNPTGVSKGFLNSAVIVFDTLNLFQWIGTSFEQATGPNVQRQVELLHHWKLEASPIEANFLHPLGHEPAIPASRPFSIRAEELDAQDWARLLKVDLMGEPLGHLLADVYRRTMNRKQVGDFIENLLKTLRNDPDIQSDYAVETIRALRQRLSAYGSSSLFDSSVEDWSAVLRPGAVSVFLLGRVPEDLRSVLVFLVIRKILEKRAQASERAKHSLLSGNSVRQNDVPPAWLVIDEAQNILPSSNITAANEILVRYVREGRNFGLSLVISTQQPSAIDSKVLAQVDTLITHTLTVRSDLNYVLANLKSGEPKKIRIGPKELDFMESIRLLETGQCMISAVDGPRCAYLEIRPRITLHGGFEA